MAGTHPWKWRSGDRYRFYGEEGRYPDEDRKKDRYAEPGWMGSFSRIRKMMHTLHRSRKVSPYEALAPCYDRLMDHVDYDEWAEYVDRVFNRYGKKIRTVIDGGCGTGSLAKSLSGLGYRIFGFDRSFEMLKNLRTKGLSLFFQADLRAIPLKQEWDAVICLYDTLQYLDPDGMVGTFREVGGILRRDAIFIFDLVTENHVKRYWRNYTERIPGKNRQLVRHSWYDPGKRRMITEFEIQISKHKQVYHEKHEQFIYTIPEIEEMITAGGFRYDRLDGFTFRKGSEDSERIHFVLIKEES